VLPARILSVFYPFIEEGRGNLRKLNEMRIGATVRLKVVILHGACKYRKRASNSRFDIINERREEENRYPLHFPRVV